MLKVRIFQGGWISSKSLINTQICIISQSNEGIKTLLNQNGIEPLPVLAFGPIPFF